MVSKFYVFKSYSIKRHKYGNADIVNALLYCEAQRLEYYK